MGSLKSLQPPLQGGKKGDTYKLSIGMLLSMWVT